MTTIEIIYDFEQLLSDNNNVCHIAVAIRGSALCFCGIPQAEAYCPAGFHWWAGERVCKCGRQFCGVCLARAYAKHPEFL